MPRHYRYWLNTDFILIDIVRELLWFTFRFSAGTASPLGGIFPRSSINSVAPLDLEWGHAMRECPCAERVAHR